jgi:hypothetical protein
MIERKTLWFLILLALAMTATAFWRLSLLPDWTQVPFTGPKGTFTRHGFVLFVPPLSLLFAIGCVFASKFLVTGPDSAIQAYQRLNRLVLLGTGVLTAVMEVFLISRSLGHGFGINAEVLARGTITVSAILIMMQGNVLPKMPSVSARFPALQLDEWQQVRSRRFTGRMSIGFGLTMIAAAALLPLRAVAPVIVVLVPFYVGVVFWNIFRLKREPSPTS